jgi:ribose transport system permease protein
MSSVTAPLPEPAAIGWRSRLSAVPTTVWPYTLFLAMLALTALVEPNTFNRGAIATTLSFAMLYALAASGQTVAILTGGIDLSVPNVITLAAMTYLTTFTSLGPIGAFAFTIAVGVLIGVINGTGVAYLGLNPIVMTIATNGALFGVILLVFSVQMISDKPELLIALTKTNIGPAGLEIPSIVLVGLGILVVLHLFLSYTGWGRQIYVLGASQEVARFVGLRTRAVRLSAYAISGGLTAIAGMMIAGYFQQTNIGMGDAYLLAGVAAVVVGGASIFGGRGSIIGTLGGALALSQLTAFLAVFNVAIVGQQILYGLAILVMAAIYVRERRA